MSSMITFAVNNDLFRKRKRVYRACESCKKRRKRCTHAFDRDEEDGPRENAVVEAPVSNGNGNPFISPSTQIRSTGTDAKSESRSRSTSPSRFIGRTNPESIFLDQSLETQPVRHECGYWMPRSENDRKSSRTQPVPDAEERALDRYLSAVNVDLLPPQEHLDALIKIYFTYVHPLLPIVDSARPGSRKSGKLLSPMLLQTICIVASRHDSARPHLILTDDGKPMGPREFGKRLYKSVNAALNAKLEHDRTVLIQVLALLSTYIEGPDGCEIASIHLVEAVHHAHTIGMQFGRARGDERAEYFQESFWCLWTLDKLNSMMNGRPIFIYDEDSRIDSPLSQAETKYSVFGIFLQIASLLNHIINYYRPRHDDCTGWEKDFPGFEEIIGDKADSMNPSLLAFLELFYHSAAIMSHKARPINEPVVSTPSFVRQSLSTVRVIQILRDECPDDLPPLPIVPWAVSLAMTHAYRLFRQSRIATHRNRAKSDLQVCCDLLDRMRSDWWTAGAMADLGQAALKKASTGKETKKYSQAPEHTVQQATPAGDPMPAALPSTMAHAVPSAVAAARISTPNQQGPGSGEISNGISPPLTIDPSISPDWLNFDTAFENFDAVLGSSGADLSMELLRPFNFEEFGSYEFPR